MAKLTLEVKDALRRLGAAGGRKAAGNMTARQRRDRARNAAAARELKRKQASK
jgi:hypothetical protein